MAWNKTGNIKGTPGTNGAPGGKGDKGDKGDPAPNQVIGSVAGVETPLTLWVGTREEYDAIGVKDELTVYVVRPEGDTAVLHSYAPEPESISGGAVLGFTYPDRVSVNLASTRALVTDIGSYSLFMVNLQTGQIIAEVPSEDDWFISGSNVFSWDGKKAFNCATPRGLVVDVETAKAVKVLYPAGTDGGQITGIVVSADKAFGTWQDLDSCKVFVVDQKTTNVVNDFPMTEQVNSLAVKADGKKLYYSSASGIYEMNPNNGSTIQKLSADRVDHISLSLNGSKLFATQSSGGSDGVSVIDTNTKVVTNIDVNQPRMTYPHPDGRRLFVASYDGTDVIVVDLVTGQKSAFNAGETVFWISGGADGRSICAVTTSGIFVQAISASVRT